MSNSQRGGTERGTERIQAFSDGVFAIAITLIVLEIKVPHLSSGSDLLTGLLGQWPAYLAYVLSFVMIGIYWANHHYIFKLIQKTDHVLNLLNLLFLLFIAFLPVPTEALGNYLLDQANQTTAVTIYALGLLFPAVTWLLMWLYASRGHQIIDPRLDAGYLRGLTLQYVGSVVLYSGAVLLSQVDFRWGLSICIGLTLLYLLPPKSPVYHRERH
jgi:uncharacterized membrane protein